MSASGNFPAVPDKPATFEADAKGLWGRVFTPMARVVVASLLVGGAGATGTYALAQSEFSKSEAKSAARADAGIAVVAKALEQHISDEKEARAAQGRFNERVMEALQKMEDRSAGRFDALQNTILDRRPQPGAAELAKPASVTDGGR